MSGIKSASSSNSSFISDASNSYNTNNLQNSVNADSSSFLNTQNFTQNPGNIFNSLAATSTPSLTQFPFFLFQQFNQHYQALSETASDMKPISSIKKETPNFSETLIKQHITQLIRNQERLNQENQSQSNDFSHSDINKKMIYEHRLFPLLKFMFEKCEQAMNNPDILLQNSHAFKPGYDHQIYQQHYIRTQAFQNDLIQNEVKSFDQELKCFLKNNQQIVQDQKKDEEEDQNLSDILLKAILVLRIHLFEIEKVNELCRDFSEKYIETLKITLNSDNMFKSDDESDEMNESTNEDVRSFNNINTHDDDLSEHPMSAMNDKFNKSLFYIDEGGNHELFSSRNKKRSSSSRLLNIDKSQKKFKSELRDLKASYEISPDTCLSKISFNMINLNNSNSNVNNDGSYESVCSEDDMNENNLDDSTSSNKKSNNEFEYDNTYESAYPNVDLNDEEDNSYDADQDEAEVDPDEDNYELALETPKLSKRFNSSAMAAQLNDDDYIFKRNSKTKRGILPKNATNVMKKWLFQHIIVSFKKFLLFLINSFFICKF